MSLLHKKKTVWKKELLCENPERNKIVKIFSVLLLIYSHFRLETLTVLILSSVNTDTYLHHFNSHGMVLLLLVDELYQ